MINFEYTAKENSGTTRQGLHSAPTKQDVLTWLREQDLTPVNIKEIGAKKIRKSSGLRKRVKSEEMASLCWQLNTMLEGGISITEALDTISNDIENPVLEESLKEMVKRIKTGETFSDSLAAYPRIFSSLFHAMILAGESGGSLPMVLQRLAIYYEKRDKIRRQIIGAISYPIFVVAFVTFMVMVIMIKIIPAFMGIFDQIQGELPAFTRAFMGVYNIIMHHGLYVLGAAIAGVIGVAMYARTIGGHEQLSKLVLKIPLLGKILTQGFLTIFCNTLATLLTAGVPIIEALNIMTGMTRNDIIKDAMFNAKNHIVEGSNISLSMAATGFFPNMMTKMTQIGEDSGSLPTVLDRTSQFYEKKVDASIKKMIGVLEPALIITVGLIVAVVVLALYLPIFSISDIKS